MDEEYLENLQKRAKVAEIEVNHLETHREKIIQDINKLRTDRAEEEKAIAEFGENQVEYSLDKIRESRNKMNDEIDKHKNVIRELNQRAYSVVEIEKELDAKENKLGKKEIRLEEKEIKIRKDKVSIESLWGDAEVAVSTLKEREEKSDSKYRLAKKTLKNAKRKLLEVMEYEKEKRGILIEKERLVKEREKLNNAQREVYLDAMKMITGEKVKIADQWYQILEAKKHLNI